MYPFIFSIYMSPPPYYYQGISICTSMCIKFTKKYLSKKVNISLYGSIFPKFRYYKKLN